MTAQTRNVERAHQHRDQNRAGRDIRESEPIGRKRPRPAQHDQGEKKRHPRRHPTGDEHEPRRLHRQELQERRSSLLRNLSIAVQVAVEAGPTRLAVGTEAEELEALLRPNATDPHRRRRNPVPKRPAPGVLA